MNVTDQNMPARTAIAEDFFRVSISRPFAWRKINKTDKEFFVVKKIVFSRTVQVLDANAQQRVTGLLSRQLRHLIHQLVTRARGVAAVV